MIFGIKEQLRQVLMTGLAAATSGGSQNFLGASWVEHAVWLAPPRSRQSVALLLVSLSPHYFFNGDRQAEADRNRTSREGLVRDVLLRHLAPSMTALDYGCGPGYMAAAVAPHVRAVEAVDISRGVLACAQVLNAAPTILYETPDEADRRTDHVDIAYSFAVVQHLPDHTFRDVLALLRRRVRPGGSLLVHFPVPDERWRTESEVRLDSSARGRAKLRFGLNCFGRSEDQVRGMVADAGFEDPRTEPLAGVTSADPDVSQQHLLVASG